MESLFRMLRLIAVAAVMFNAAVLLPGCERDSDMEDAAEEVGEAVEDAGEEIKDAAD